MPTTPASSLTDTAKNIGHNIEYLRCAQPEKSTDAAIIGRHHQYA